MDSDLSEYSVSVLSKMYERCVDALSKEESEKLAQTGSLVYLLHGMSSNRRSDVLRCTESMRINEDTVSELERNGCIRTGTTSNNFIPKMYGLWVIESVNFDVKKFLEYVDRVIEESDTKELTADNKVVLATCIASRTFGPNAIVDLKKGEAVQNAWWGILVEISRYLKEYGVINKSFDEYVTKSSIESGVSLKFRHTENIPRRTRGIFAKNGSNGYYLDVSDNDHHLDVEKLAFIIAATFGKVLNDDNVRQISRYMIRFYRENLTMIAQESYTEEFDDRETVDKVMEDAFQMALDNLELWKFKE